MSIPVNVLIGTDEIDALVWKLRELKKFAQSYHDLDELRRIIETLEEIKTRGTNEKLSISIDGNNTSLTRTWHNSNFFGNSSK